MNRRASQQGSVKLRGNWGQIRTYADLQEQLHREWVDANGDCPTCDSYDQRLVELITAFQSATRKSVIR
jgi:hypothetical protein